jgi:cell division protease FtsH
VTEAGPWRPYSEETARLIDAEVRRVLENSHAEALRLYVHRAELDALAQALLEHETLDEQEILNVRGLRPVHTAASCRSQSHGRSKIA